MSSKSPFERVRELEKQIQSVYLYLDIDGLSQAQRKLMDTIRNQATDIRLDIRDYGMADTKATQDRLKQAAQTRLDQLQKNIVAASQYNLFSAIDVAVLTADIQQIISDL